MEASNDLKPLIMLGARQVGKNLADAGICQRGYMPVVRI